LWSDPAPVAPWEWRAEEQAQKGPEEGPRRDPPAGAGEGAETAPTALLPVAPAAVSPG